MKLMVTIALHTALAGKVTGCRASTDSRTVSICIWVAFEPDAVIDCGLRDPDSLLASAPDVVIEVFSPSSYKIDGDY